MTMPPVLTGKVYLRKENQPAMVGEVIEKFTEYCEQRKALSEFNVTEVEGVVAEFSFGETQSAKEEKRDVLKVVIKLVHKEAWKMALSLMREFVKDFKQGLSSRDYIEFFEVHVSFRVEKGV